MLKTIASGLLAGYATAMQIGADKYSLMYHELKPSSACTNRDYCCKFYSEKDYQGTETIY